MIISLNSPLQKHIVLAFEHGHRSAVFVAELHSEGLLGLTDIQYDLLYEAIHDHTNVNSHSNLTIGSCWDSDRLDIGRVGREPKVKFLNTVTEQHDSIILARVTIDNDFSFLHYFCY